MSEYRKPQILEEKPRKKPEMSPKEELDILEQEKNQKEEIDINSLDYKNFDYNQLKDIPEKYHKEIALKLIENDGYYGVRNQLKYFSGLDKEVFIKLLDKGVKAYDKVSYVSRLDEEVVDRLIKSGDGWFVILNPEFFSGLVFDKEFVVKYIKNIKHDDLYGDRGALKNLLNNFSVLNLLPDEKYDIISMIVDNGYIYGENSVYYLFSDLDKYNLTQEQYKELFTKLITLINEHKINISRYENFFTDTMKFFSSLTNLSFEELKELLFQIKPTSFNEDERVFKYLNFNDNNEYGYVDYLYEEKFRKTLSFLKSLTSSDYKKIILNYNLSTKEFLENFENGLQRMNLVDIRDILNIKLAEKNLVDPKFILDNGIATKKRETVICEKIFEAIDFSFFNKIVDFLSQRKFNDELKMEFLIKYIKNIFIGLNDLDYKKIVFHLIDENWQGLLKKNIDNFPNQEGLINLVSLIRKDESDEFFDSLGRYDKLNIEDYRFLFLKSIRNGFGDKAIKEIKKFPGINLDKNTALEIIDAEEKWATEKNQDRKVKVKRPAVLARNLNEFTGLDKEVAYRLIETKRGDYVIDNSTKFIGFELNKETAHKIIENGNLRLIFESLDKFFGLDKEILFKIINTKEFDNVKNKLDNFDLSEKIQAKDFTVLSTYPIGNSLDFLNEYIEDEIFKQGFTDDQIIKNLYIDEWALACQKNPDLKFEEIKKVMFEAKAEKMPENLAEEDKKAFEEMSNIFGAENLAKFIKLKDRSYFHIAQNNISKMYEASGLSPEKFTANILLQVSGDSSKYNGFDSFDFLNTLGDSINLDTEKTFQEAKSFSNLELMKLVTEMENQGPFVSWKFLKKYYEICQILNQREVLEKLEVLKKENRLKQYDFFSKLAFHPNINSQAVFEFMENPERFLDIEEVHASDSHERKKPSNYLDFPHLDITAENLRDALVEGKMDNLQFYQEMAVNYQVPKNEILDIDLVSMIVNRMEKIRDTAFNFKELGKQVQEIVKKYNFNPKDFLNNPNNKLPIDLKNDLENVLFGKNGLKRDVDEFVTTVHPKSSPDGHVAGNDTACCMPFGSGKNNVYMYNLGCATLTVQKKMGDGKLRTVAQSVLTPDVDIKQNVSEIKNDLLSERNKIHEVLKEDLSKKQKIVITADNIEVAHNFVKNNADFDQMLKFIYQDFFQKYLEKMKKEQNLDSEKMIIGMGYTDALKSLPTGENTFVPIIPPGYSDNTGNVSYILDLTEKPKANIISEVLKFEKRESNQAKTNLKLEKGVRLLTAKDTLPISYLEGKIYADNESLIQYIHRIGNELIAKDINNEFKNRPNLSLAVENNKGDIDGYIIAYEGVLEKQKSSKEGYHDEDDNWIEEYEDETDLETDLGENNCIYVSDLAAKPDSILVGGKLLKSFATLIEENYLKKDNPIPIFAQARDQTSYPIIAKQINKLGNKYGYTYEMEEIGDYNEGQDTMHKVILKPKKIKK